MKIKSVDMISVGGLLAIGSLMGIVLRIVAGI